MKINPQYKIRQIAGEHIVVKQGTTSVDMTRIISLNSSALLLYQELADKEFSIEDAAQVLIDTYGIDSEKAMTDVSAWANALKECSIIE